ncbi:hypothetical protein SH2C18_03410 [Clostridium sediminicola]|uniref:lamin tail domain-containing protein n=1 Tax=Clostridium sediminicola TaxID=3114879 RepID=UPI0031F1D693
MKKTKKLFISAIIMLVVMFGTLLPTTQALAANGWVSNGQSWNYYTNNQIVKNNWVKDSAGRCYFMGNDGTMTTGWAKSGSAWYLFTTDGVMESNKWVQSGSTWYYLGSNGAMVANGWAQDSASKKWYYFDANGLMLCNTWIGKYYLGTDGAMATATNNANVKIASVDLSQEIVTIKNDSASDVNMSGWKLVSVEGNQTYNFPSNYVLKAGATITIASGKSTGSLKWTGSYIWNNDGDAAQLYNASNQLVSSK